MDENPANVVAIALADRLSDSGIVGILVGTSVNDTLEIEEVAVSCRALGRRIEDTMLTQALLLMLEGRGLSRVRFFVNQGPRNAPALEWLEAYAGVPVAPGEAFVSMPVEGIRRKALSDAVSITIIPPAVHA